MSKDHPITEHKIAKLREQGEIPVSGLAISFGAILGASVALKCCPRIDSWSFNLKEGMFWLLMPPLGAFLGALLVGLMQSRFFLRLSVSGFYHFKEMSVKRFESRSIFLQGLIFVLLVLIGIMFFRSLVGSAQQFYLAEVIDPGSLLSMVGVAYRRFFMIMLFSVISFVVFGAIYFRLFYRMTRDELEAEMKEGEMRSEYRRALGASSE
jgi:phosphate/sulfate permease